MQVHTLDLDDMKRTAFEMTTAGYPIAEVQQVLDDEYQDFGPEYQECCARVIQEVSQLEQIQN